MERSWSANAPKPRERVHGTEGLRVLANFIQGDKMPHAGSGGGRCGSDWGTDKLDRMRGASSSEHGDDGKLKKK